MNFRDVILTGGTGRSGTTVVGKLLSRHPAIGLSRPAEIKMLTSGNGLLDISIGNRVGRYKRFLLTDRLQFERFAWRIRHEWWERESKFGDSTGLKLGLRAEELDELLRKMRRAVSKGRVTAAQSFIREYIDIQKRKSGKPDWVETTPKNLLRSVELDEFMPGVRFIHMVRDGRDVISSVIRESWGPSNYDEGLTWWSWRMHKILESSRILGNKVGTFSLEDLAVLNREATYQRLIKYVGIEDDAQMRRYFETEVLPEKVSQGRWKREVHDPDGFSVQYYEVVARLKRIDPSVPLRF